MPTTARTLLIRHVQQPPATSLKAVMKRGGLMNENILAQASQSVSTTLLQAARQGENAAWSRLDKLFRAEVLSWFTQHWKLNRETAEDLVQVTFSKVLGGLHRFSRERPGGTFKGWLWTIARNEAMEHFRRSAQQARIIGGTEHQVLLNELPEELPEEKMDELQLKLRRLWEIVRGDIQETTRLIFERLVFDDRTSGEVAAEFGKKPNAVREAKCRVLGRLREEWKELYGEWPFDREEL